MRSNVRSMTCAAIAGAILLLGQTASAQSVEPEHLSQLEYRTIGPDGNRAIAIAGEPGNNDVVYVGAASGGIWKTTDGGLRWKPVFDDVDVASVGSLAIAPSDPNVVWAGTGETFVIRPALAMGNGIYRSTDAGETWTHLGLEKTGRIGRVVVHPTNPDIALACAAGHIYGPQPERGIFRTVDGGASWEKVLFVDENTGCADLAMDPTNPRILVAGMWPAAQASAMSGLVGCTTTRPMRPVFSSPRCVAIRGREGASRWRVSPARKDCGRHRAIGSRALVRSHGGHESWILPIGQWRRSLDAREQQPHLERTRNLLYAFRDLTR